MHAVRTAGVTLVMPVVLAAALLAQEPTAETAARFDLSIDNIMRGPELYGTPPSLVRFSDDSRYVYFRWRRPGVDTAAVSFRVSVAGGQPEALSSIAEDTP